MPPLLETTGYDNTSKNPETKEKKKVTTMKHYGVSHHMFVSEVKDKIKKNASKIWVFHIHHNRNRLNKKNLKLVWNISEQKIMHKVMLSKAKYEKPIKQDMG